jgi:hypothetical protein
MRGGFHYPRSARRVTVSERARNDGSSARLGHDFTDAFQRLTTSLDGKCAFADVMRPRLRGQMLTVVGSHESLRAITPHFSRRAISLKSSRDHRERQAQGLNDLHSMPERTDTGITV